MKEAVMNAHNDAQLLVAYQGKPLSGVDDLRRALTEDSIGRSARLTVVRERGPEDVAVTPRENLN